MISIPITPADAPVPFDPAMATEHKLWQARGMIQSVFYQHHTGKACYLDAKGLKVLHEHKVQIEQEMRKRGMFK